MRRFLLGLLLAAAGLVGAAPSYAAGAWKTLLRPYNYTDLFAEQDTVWCATAEAGLLRYDRGTGTFTSYTREPGALASNQLSALAQDRSRRLWVGTMGRGVSRLAANGTWDLLNRFDGLPSDSVTAITAIGDTVWIGTTAGLALWDGRRVVGSLPDGVNPSPFTNNWITGIVHLRDSLYIATQSGSWVSRISTGLILWSPFHSPFFPTVQWKTFVTDGTRILGLTGTDVFTHAAGAGDWQFLNDRVPNPIHRLVENRGDVLAAGETGLYRWNGTGWTLINDAVLSNASSGSRFIYAPASDETGRVAAANIDGLLTEPTGGAQPWPLAPVSSPPGNEILNLAVDGPRVYVTTMTEGIGRYDGTQWRNWPPVACTGCDTTFESPLFPFSIEVDRRGHKWFGMWQVAVEELDDSVDPPRVIHHNYPGNQLQTSTWPSAIDSVHGGIWFGGDTPSFGSDGWTPLGLLYYNRAGEDSLNLRQDSLAAMRGTKVHGLTVDRLGRVWFGFTGEGIQYFDWPTAGQPFDIRTVPGSENFDVRAMLARGDSIYVTTTRDVRIYRRSAAFVDSFLLPSVNAGLDTRPLAIGNDGTLYAGTTAGLRARKLDGSIFDYNVSNSPLAGDEVRAIDVDPATGVLWIGTTLGLNRFDPGYTPPPPPPPPSALDFTIYPNPIATTALGISLRIEGNASAYEGVVVDLNGREVHRFRGTGNRGVIWDGRHQGGNRVRPGIYFVRVEVGGKSAIRRIAVVR